MYRLISNIKRQYRLLFLNLTGHPTQGHITDMYNDYYANYDDEYTEYEFACMLDEWGE